MRWIKHPLCLRRANRVNALSAVREERLVSRMFWPIWLPVLVSFCDLGICLKHHHSISHLYWLFNGAHSARCSIDHRIIDDRWDYSNGLPFFGSSKTVFI